MITVLIDLPNRYMFNIMHTVHSVSFTLVLMVVAIINLAACAVIIIEIKQMYIYILYF